MTSQNLAGVLKSHWWLAIIAIAVAALAFAAGALASNRGAANEPTPATTPDPTDMAVDPTAMALLYGPPDATLDPTAVALLYGPPPTHEEFDRALREAKRKQAASDSSGENLSSGPRVIITTPLPRSTAEAQFREAPLGRALYFVASDKVIFLPEGVERSRWITAISCYGGLPVCPEAPVTVLKNGEATVSLDAYGDVVPGLFDTDDPDAFPFLKEHGE